MTEELVKKREALAKLPNYRGEVISKNNIRSLPDVEVNNIYWVAMDEKAYIVSEKGGKKVTIKALDENATISTGITIYELNQQIVAKEPLLDWEDGDKIKEIDEALEHWFYDILKDNEYFLLYGRTLHYFSLITRKLSADHKNLLEVLKELIDPVAKIISIDVYNDDEPKVEIWVRMNDSTAELLYFFPYDNGIVKI